MKKNLHFLLCLLAAITAPVLAQNCKNATAQYELHGNQVRANLLNGGDAFWDLRKGRFFADTSNANATLMFAGAIWIGGYDAGGNLHTAAQTYRQNGNDFWPGPIDANTGATNLATCNIWDKIWHVSGYEVRQFITDWNDNHLINWAASENILKYPGRNNPYFQQENGFALPQNQDFAPFFDRNSDGTYNPMQGDYPIVPNTNGTVIADDLAWTVFNDEGANAPHGESRGRAMKAEIQMTYYAFNYAQPTFLNNTIYGHYKLINKSIEQYDSTYIGFWTDPDLGCYNDDYIGSAPQFSTMFAYNADASDAVICLNGGQAGFGHNTPALAITFLNPRMSNCGYYINNTAPAPPPGMANPYLALEYYNYLRGQCNAGIHCYLNHGVPDTLGFVYTGNPRDITGWSMYQEQLIPRDYRLVGATAHGSWLPQTTKEMTMAFSYHIDKAGLDSLVNLSSVDTMYAHLGPLINHYNNSYTTAGLTQSPPCTGNCMLPGDTNRDGLVNSWDYLYPATSYFETGTPRADRTARFLPTFSANWATSLAGNLNKKHLDCDGNGIINPMDFAVIDQYYGESMPGSTIAPSNETNDFYFVERNGTPITDSLIYPIGTSSNYFTLRGDIPGANFYGIAFTVELDDSVFVAAWRSTLRKPQLHYGSYKHILKEYISPVSNRPYKWDVVMTATDGQTTGANTDLMRLYFDLDSRLNLQNLPPETKGHITFSNARMIDNNGETLPYGLKSTHICLSTCVQNIAPSDSSSTKNSLDKFSTFPNPVQDNLSVELTDSDHAMLRIYNLMGNLLIEKELKQTRSTTDVSLLQRGIYLVEISDETGKATHRILK